MKDVHVTFDIETLGTDFNAPVVQLAAVKFKDYEIIDEFNEYIEIDSLTKRDYVPDIKTVMWWMSQEHHVMKSVFFSEPRVKIGAVLNQFYYWMSREHIENVWCHSTFDYGILKTTYAKEYMKCPIGFRNIRDIRTLESLTDGGAKRAILKQKHRMVHDALTDCKIQAEYIAYALSLISNKK